MIIALTVFTTIYVGLVGVGLWNHFDNPAWILLLLGILLIPIWGMILTIYSERKL